MRPVGSGRWCDEHGRLECVTPRKNGRGPCHGPAVTGDDQCRMHMGKRARPVIAEAKLNEQAAAELARLDVPPVVDPFLELSKLAGQAVEWKNQLAGRVNTLTQLRYEGGQGTEQLRSEIALWERALDRSATMLTAMSRLDIESRLVGIRRQTANMLEDALMAALAASGADLAGQARAREEFRSRLRVADPEPEGPKALPAGA